MSCGIETLGLLKRPLVGIFFVFQFMQSFSGVFGKSRDVLVDLFNFHIEAEDEIEQGDDGKKKNTVDSASHSQKAGDHV